ncbi:hypothetical protein BC936DRAFT_139802 [Jimgerdemannia flammicorona]|uniref:Uncharacterized protein n=1 Tax=Jimgerdemannia flammicorona TaxID=994334 RepID=A0A433B980_9FUNG|nr:hypothetical protein BC936DRAFT_139802 [Jimgerdemannia flammicorona]
MGPGITPGMGLNREARIIEIVPLGRNTGYTGWSELGGGGRGVPRRETPWTLEGCSTKFSLMGGATR